MKNNDLIKILKFLHLAGNLKKTYRYSATRKIPKESVADHCWRLALMSFIIAEELKLKIDLLRAIKIALAHDLAEAITGDIDYILIYKNKISAADKRRAEIKAIKKIEDILPAGLGREIYNLWHEYESGKSFEAKYIKALDKIEALAYLEETGSVNFLEPASIPDYADKEVLNFPKLKPILKIIKNKMRKEYIKNKVKWKPKYNNLT